MTLFDLSSQSMISVLSNIPLMIICLAKNAACSHWRWRFRWSWNALVIWWDFNQNRWCACTGFMARKMWRLFSWPHWCPSCTKQHWDAWSTPHLWLTFSLLDHPLVASSTPCRGHLEYSQKWREVHLVMCTTKCSFHFIRFVSLLLEVQIFIYEGRVIHLGFHITRIIVGQLSSVIVSCSRSCFYKKSILPWPIKSWGTYVH